MSSSPTYKIGVDGGGTKTEFILVDATGAVVAQHLGPGCNPSQAGADGARATLLSGLTTLLSWAGIDPAATPVATTHIYAAGAPEFWREVGATLTGFGQVVTGDDSVPVLELATGGTPGIVLHAGTGSFIAARAPDGGVYYAGGFGWKLGDPGSGFDLGRRGIVRALLELNGWVEATPLGDALRVHAGLLEPAAIKRRLYSDPAANALIISFAPEVVKAAAAGCVPAQAALNESVGELVAQAQLVTARLFPAMTGVTCGISGAILNSPPAAEALRAVVTARAWPVLCTFITEPPAEGVRRLLARS